MVPKASVALTALYSPFTRSARVYPAGMSRTERVKAGRVAIAGTAAAAAQINLNGSRAGVEAEISIGAKLRLLSHLGHIPTEVEGSQWRAMAVA